MIKQSTRTAKHVKEFKRELGRILFESRMEKGLTLTQVSQEFGWDIRFLERMEIGRVPLLYIWKTIRLLCFYGKKLRLETDVHISPKKSV